MAEIDLKWVKNVRGAMVKTPLKNGYRNSTGLQHSTDIDC